MAESAKVKVRMKTHVIGTPSYSTGEIVDLEPRIAKAWIDEGMCVPLTDEPKRESR
jgi:hypothetical protein